jgi:hypothetical protein
MRRVGAFGRGQLPDGLLAEAPFDMELITAWQPPAKPGQG